MNKYFCPICGYIIENEKLKSCPICNSICEEFKEINEKTYFSNNKIGIAKNADEDMICNLRNIFSKECSEVGTYLAMSKIADKEGYVKISNTFKEIAYEEANHAALMAELLGEVVKPHTNDNLKSIIEGEYNSVQNILKLSKKAKESGLDIIYNILNEMCKDETRQGKKFVSLLNEYFVEE